MEVLLQHYGASFMTSQKLQASLEAMQLEIGCSGNPLNEDYGILGQLATEGLVKAVWERTSYYGYTITLDYPVERPPREGDVNLVAIFTKSGKQGKELVSLNRCRLTHQAKYLSCLSAVDRKYLDPTYLSPPLTKERLSFDRFAREEPTKQDWITWERFWRTYCNRFLTGSHPSWSSLFHLGFFSGTFLRVRRLVAMFYCNLLPAGAKKQETKKIVTLWLQ